MDKRGVSLIRRYQRALHRRILFLAVQYGRILGTIAVVEGGEESHGHIPWTISAAPEEISTLHLLAVELEMQGRGIGSTLLKLYLGEAGEPTAAVYRQQVSSAA